MIKERGQGSEGNTFVYLIIMSLRVSSGPPRSGPPVHPNKVGFHHNPCSKLTKYILALPISDNLCLKCKEVIEWKKKYRKYKPLTVPKKCTLCDNRNIKDAYHVICKECSEKIDKCSKCQGCLNDTN